MQDIPRNELLDKIAAGWKVQRKTYSMPSPALEIGLVRLSDLLANDWEGEPPEAVLVVRDCGAPFAFEELKQKDAKFIRRSAWNVLTKRIEGGDEGDEVYLLTLDDIISTDWEVWQ